MVFRGGGEQLVLSVLEPGAALEGMEGPWCPQAELQQLGGSALPAGSSSQESGLWREA